MERLHRTLLILWTATNCAGTHNASSLKRPKSWKTITMTKKADARSLRVTIQEGPQKCMHIYFITTVCPERCAASLISHYKYLLRTLLYMFHINSSHLSASRQYSFRATGKCFTKYFKNNAQITKYNMYISKHLNYLKTNCCLLLIYFIQSRLQTSPFSIRRCLQKWEVIKISSSSLPNKYPQRIWNIWHRNNVCSDRWVV